MRATRNDLPPSIATTADLLRAVIACAGRGTVQEAGLGAVIVRVPFYRVRRIRAALGTRLPATIRLDVRRLTLRQHFTLWGACALPAPNLGDKP